MREAQWTFPMEHPNEQRAVARTSVQYPGFSELSGVDGQLMSEASPFPGFKLAYTMDGFQSFDFDTQATADTTDQWDSADAAYTAPLTFHDASSWVQDDPNVVEWRKDSENYCYGVVYRVNRSTAAGDGALGSSTYAGDATIADIFVDYWDNEFNEWCKGNLVMYAVDPYVPMDVVVHGRLVYVLQKGRSPAVFYVPSTSELEETEGAGNVTTTCGKIVVTGQTSFGSSLPGPGLKPTLRSPEQSAGLGNLTSTGDASRDAAGQVVLTDKGPLASGLFDGILGGESGGDSQITIPYTGDIGDTSSLHVEQTVEDFYDGNPIALTLAANTSLIVVQILHMRIGTPGNVTAVKWTDTGTATDDAMTADGSNLSTGLGPQNNYQSRQETFYLNGTTQSGAGTITLTVSGNDPDYVRIWVVDGHDATTPIVLNTYRGRDTQQPHATFSDSDGESAGTLSLGAFTHVGGGTALEPQSGSFYDYDLTTGSHPVVSMFREQPETTTEETHYRLQYEVTNTFTKQPWGGCLTVVRPATYVDPEVGAPGLVEQPPRIATYTYETDTVTLGDTVTVTPAVGQLDAGHVLVVAIYSQDATATDRDIDSCTYNGNAMTEFGSAQTINGGADSEVALYYYVVTQDQPSGGVLEFATASGSGDTSEFVVAISVVRGGSIADPFVEATLIPDSDTGNGGTANQSVSIAAVPANSLMVGWFIQASNDAQSDYDGEEEMSVEGSSQHQYLCLSKRTVTGGATTLGYDHSGSATDYAYRALVFAHDPAGYNFGDDVPPEGDDAVFDDNFEITLLEPGDGDDNVNVNAQLAWRGQMANGDPLPPDLTYEIYFWRAGVEEETLVETTTNDTFNPGTLDPSGNLRYGARHNWKIRARLTGSTDYSGVSSETFTFTTSDEFDARKLEPGDYVFSVVFSDSRTGRKSAISEIAQARSEDFPFEDSTDDDSITGNLARVDQYAAVELIYDSDKYDRASIFRSVKTQDAGGTLIAAYQHLDQFIQLSTYHTSNNGAGQTFPNSQSLRQAVYWYRLEDKPLVHQESYNTLPNFDDKMPYAGAGVAFNETMIVSDIQGGGNSTADELRQDDVISGLGELRWSAQGLKSFELFAPSNRYTPSVPGDEALRLYSIGGNVVGLSKDRMYHIGQGPGYLEVREMHEGILGLVSWKASTVAGSRIFLVGPAGLKMVDPYAKLDHIRNFDYLLKEEWKNDHADLSMAYDPYMQVVYLLNPNQEEARLLWLDTSMLTSLRDVPFSGVCTGPWPKTPSAYGTALTRRAIFLDNGPRETPNELVTGWTPKLYVVDAFRSRTVTEAGANTNGDLRLTMLDPTGDARLAVTSADAGTKRITLTLAGGDLGDNLQNCYLYVIGGRESLLWRKAKIKRDLGSGVLQLRDTDATLCTDIQTAITASETVRVGISPVPVRIIGSPVGVTQDDVNFGPKKDFYRKRTVSAIRASFGTPTGAPSTDGLGDNRWRALLYKRTETDATWKAWPRDFDDDVRALNEDGESLYNAPFDEDSGAFDSKGSPQGVTLTPGIELICPDINFQLLGFQVEGTIDESLTTRRE